MAAQRDKKLDATFTNCKIKFWCLKLSVKRKTGIEKKVQYKPRVGIRHSEEKLVY